MKHHKVHSKRIIPISIVVPTYNEEKYLPKLLQSIKSQSVQPVEIIVADNNSTDNTTQIAKQFGAKVVQGGDVSTGRNSGVKHSSQDIIFAFDADVILKRTDDLLQLYEYFTTHKLDVANPIIELECNRCAPRIRFMNKFYKAIMHVSKALKHPLLGVGPLTIFTKEYFYKVNGFSIEFSGNAEDLLFTKQARKLKMKYGVVPITITTSNRRFIKGTRQILKVFMWGGLVGLLITLNIKNNKLLRLAKRIYGRMGGG